MNNDYEPSNWVPIPSTGGKYEVSKAGNVRNAKTKRRLKLTKSKTYLLSVGGKLVAFSVAKIFWEVFGIMPKKFHHHPVILSKRTRLIHFDSFTDAAKFLAKENYYSFGYLRLKLSLRKPEVCRWRVNYLDDHMPKAFPDNARGRKEN